MPIGINIVLKKEIPLVMFYPYVTYAIDNPSVRDVLDKYIRWDKLVSVRPKLLFNIDTEKSVIFGCAAEILVSFLVSSNTEIGFQTDRYEECLEVYLSKVPTEFNQNYKKLYVYNYRFRNPHNYIEGRSTAKNISEDEPVCLQSIVNEYRDAIRDIKGNSNELFNRDKRKTLLAILTISKYYAGMKTPNRNINPKCYSVNLEQLLIPLESIIETFSMEPMKGQELFVSEPHFSHMGISGYGDFIIDKTLIEVKSTRSYVRKADIRQVALYYLLNKATPDPKKCYKIENITIYYPLFQSCINLPISIIFNTIKTSTVVNELERIFKNRSKYGFY